MIERHIRTPIMHRVVEANGFVFLGGIVADDHSLDMKGQTQQVLDKLDRYLAEVGTDKSKIVTATVYVSDLNQKGPMNEVWTEWLAPENLPARATLGVADLGSNVLLEVVVTAVK